MQPPSDVVTLTVDSVSNDERLDKWISVRLSGLTRSRIQRLIQSNDILVNGKASKIGGKLRLGDIVTVFVPPPPPSHLTPKPLNLDIIYEDDAIVVINKPAGLVVHPGAGETGTTLVEGLLYHAGQLGDNFGPQGNFRPGIVHRLDKDTTGVMVCAKTTEALAKLAAQFAAKTNDREYVAIVNGTLNVRELVYESYLFRDPKSRLRFASISIDEYHARFGGMEHAPSGYRYAKSTFTREAVFGGRISLMSVRLSTGRTHQIRVHSCELGIGVVGDPIYGKAVVLPLHFDPLLRQQIGSIARQMLHARLLGIDHPTTGKRMEFMANVPADFEGLLDKLQRYRTDA